MKTRTKRVCAGGCGRTSVAIEGWTCWRCTEAAADKAILSGMLFDDTQPQNFNDRTLIEVRDELRNANFLLNEIMILLKERL